MAMNSGRNSWMCWPKTTEQVSGLWTLRGRPNESRVKINDWVSKETEGKIRDILPPGTVDSFTRLVLTNAIYFNASWTWPFDERLTQERPFHLAEGGGVRTPMMAETSDDFYGYAKGKGYQAVDLPYSRGEMSMTILLPDAGEVPRVRGLPERRGTGPDP